MIGAIVPGTTCKSESDSSLRSSSGAAPDAANLILPKVFETGRRENVKDMLPWGRVTSNKKASAIYIPKIQIYSAEYPKLVSFGKLRMPGRTAIPYKESRGFFTGEVILQNRLNLCGIGKYKGEDSKFCCINS